MVKAFPGAVDTEYPVNKCSNQTIFVQICNEFPFINLTLYIKKREFVVRLLFHGDFDVIML